MKKMMGVSCLQRNPDYKLMHEAGINWQRSIITFPFKEKNLATAQRWFQKLGIWSLLLAWMPIGGDALTFVAGIMRVRFAVFITLTGIGKATRYGILLVLLQYFTA